MSDASLHQLERDVELARAKLAGDLFTLRSPVTYSQFTAGLKDEAKSSVQSTIESVFDDLKARAAANPAATLAIGAGLAWRLIQRPPIATALVGAGLYSLMRTTPIRPALRTREGYLTQAKDRLAEQAGDFATAVKERAAAMSEATTEKAAELTARVKDQMSVAADAATEKAAELSDAAGEKMRDWSGEARAAARHVSAGVAGTASTTSATLEDMKQSSMRAAETAASRAAAISDEWSRPVQETLTDPEARDKLLLGAAGVAVIAALGLACQRRMTERAEVD
jgi:hypothetical protein